MPHLLAFLLCTLLAAAGQAEDFSSPASSLDSWLADEGRPDSSPNYNCPAESGCDCAAFREELGLPPEVPDILPCDPKLGCSPECPSMTIRCLSREQLKTKTGNPECLGLCEGGEIFLPLEVCQGEGLQDGEVRTVCELLTLRDSCEEKLEKLRQYLQNPAGSGLTQHQVLQLFNSVLTTCQHRCVRRHEARHGRDFAQPEGITSCRTESNAFEESRRCWQDIYREFCPPRPGREFLTPLCARFQGWTCENWAGQEANQCICRHKFDQCVASPSDPVLLRKPCAQQCSWGGGEVGYPSPEYQRFCPRQSTPNTVDNLDHAARTYCRQQWRHCWNTINLRDPAIPDSRQWCANYLRQRYGDVVNSCLYGYASPLCPPDQSCRSLLAECQAATPIQFCPGTPAAERLEAWDELFEDWAELLCGPGLFL